MYTARQHPEIEQAVAGPLAEQRGTEEPGHRDAQGPRISACIVCRNEADLLGACLESVSWVDEIVVLDLSSTDCSAAVAREHGARVIVGDPAPYAELVRGEVFAAASGEWILALDPDERVTLGLARELRRLSQRGDIDAIKIPRTNYYLGHAPSDPYQRYEQHARMFRRRGTLEWPAVVHGIATAPEDRLYWLPKRDDLVLVHDGYRNIPEILDRFVRYVPPDAQVLVDRGQPFTARGMLAALTTEIDKQFFRGRAWRDGVPGILRASILVAYRFFVWAMFWQLSGGQRTATDDRFVQRLGTIPNAARHLAGLAGACRRSARRLLGGRSG